MKTPKLTEVFLVKESVDAELQACLDTVKPELLKKPLSFLHWNEEVAYQGPHMGSSAPKGTVFRADKRQGHHVFNFEFSDEFPVAFVVTVNTPWKQSDLTGRNITGDGFILDVEIYFLDGEFEFVAMIWHYETRVKTEEEGVALAKKIMKYVDSKSLFQLANETKVGKIGLTTTRKFEERE